MFDMQKTLLAAAIAACAATAQAATVTVTFDNPIFNGIPSPSYDAVNITFTDPESAREITKAVHAGRFQGKAESLDGVDENVFVNSVDQLWMYCYDIYETIGPGQTVTYTIDFEGVQERTLDFLGAVNAVLDPDGNDPWAWLRPTTGYEAAAIQLGIWESLYETGENWNIADGTFRATGLEAETASALENYFDKISTAERLARPHTMVLKAEGAQDMITGDPRPNDVPAPGTLALLLGPAGLLAFGRRRKASDQG